MSNVTPQPLDPVHSQFKLRSVGLNTCQLGTRRDNGNAAKATWRVRPGRKMVRTQQDEATGTNQYASLLI